jgi:Zn-dependent peptidase ImmA (M78 family)/DNA-binding XRE family transcriptional regulator
MQLSENLRRIRSAKKLSQVELAEKAGISRMGYRKIEAGESEPRGETLMAIARALEVRVQELLVPVRALKRVRFRAQKKLNNRDQLLAAVALQLDHYELLEELLGDRPQSVLANLRTEVAKLRGDSRAKLAAERARQAFGLSGDGNLIRDICGLLEDNGVKVLTPSVATDGFFGMSVSDDDGGPAVVINTWDRISVERWIFTAAHELGHLLLHLNAYEVDQTVEDEHEEKEADTFASYFLMPEDTFTTELKGAAGLSSYDRIFKLKRIFRVSYRTVLLGSQRRGAGTSGFDSTTNTSAGMGAACPAPSNRRACHRMNSFDARPTKARKSRRDSTGTTSCRIVSHDWRGRRSSRMRSPSAKPPRCSI